MKYLTTTLVALAALSTAIFAVSITEHWTRTDGQSTDVPGIHDLLSKTQPKDVNIRNNGLSTEGTIIVTVFYKDPVKVVTATLTHGTSKMFDDPGLVDGDVVVIQDIPDGQISSGGWTVHNP